MYLSTTTKCIGFQSLFPLLSFKILSLVSIGQKLLIMCVCDSVDDCECLCIIAAMMHIFVMC